MRKFIFIAIVILGVFFKLDAQKLRGYLGKKYIVGANFHIMPALEISDSYYTLNATYDGYKERFININSRKEFSFGYIYSRKSIVKFDFSHGRTGFKNHWSSDNILLLYSMDVLTYGLKWEVYLNDQLPAPMGAYMQLGVSMVNSRLSDVRNTLYGENGQISRLINFEFEDPKYSVWNPAFFLTFGKKHVLFKDNLLLDYGCSFGIVVKKFGADFASSYDTYSNEGKIINLDEEAITKAQLRARGFLSTDIYIGLNWLF